jgi:hypothetical protein
MAQLGENRESRGARKEKKAAVASGPKFREETPKKGYGMTTPSPYRTAIITHCLFPRQD